jgi:ferrous iron transport protein A
MITITTDIETESQVQETQYQSLVADEGSDVTHIVPLESLNAGEVGQVCDVLGSQEIVTRLREMGLGEGSQLRMIRPGRPCLVAIGNQRLSFRFEEELVILVEVRYRSTKVAI